VAEAPAHGPGSGSLAEIRNIVQPAGRTSAQARGRGAAIGPPATLPRIVACQSSLLDLSGCVGRFTRRAICSPRSPSTTLRSYQLCNSSQNCGLLPKYRAQRHLGGDTAPTIRMPVMRPDGHAKILRQPVRAHPRALRARARTTLQPDVMSSKRQQLDERRKIGYAGKINENWVHPRLDRPSYPGSPAACLESKSPSLRV
jgi:hypothetical protein